MVLWGGGATGDQSYSEAIVKSYIIIYECFSWKLPFLQAKQKVANEIDPSKQLSRTIELLANAKTKDDLIELKKLLEDNSVIANLIKYQQKIIIDYNLKKLFLSRLKIFLNSNIKDQITKTAPKEMSKQRYGWATFFKVAVPIVAVTVATAITKHIKGQNK